MKSTQKTLTSCLFVLVTLVAWTQATTGYHYISGTYYNNRENTVTCGCNTPGLMVYTGADGKNYTLIICFDTEPGSFYEIFDKEIISVEGTVKSVLCSDSKNYLVLYVTSSTLEMMNRRELVPEFIKKQSSISEQQTKEGTYTPKGSTMDDWSGLRHCTECGWINHDRNIIVNFDRIKTSPSFQDKIKVWGNQEGNQFWVTKWEKIN